MVFPLSDGKIWDPNNLFDNDTEAIKETVGGESIDFIHRGAKWTSRITELDIPYSINNNDFEKAMMISVVQDSTLIYKRSINEVYVRNVGLIQKDAIILDRNQTSGLPLEEDADKGYIYHLSILEYN